MLTPSFQSETTQDSECGMSNLDQLDQVEESKREEDEDGFKEHPHGGYMQKGEELDPSAQNYFKKKKKQKG